MKHLSVSKNLYKAASALELIIGVCVLALCIACGLSILLPFEPFHNMCDVDTFHSGLSNASYIIIGVEFIKMIVSHKVESVLDIIAFALSREMIVHETTPLENLLTVIGVALLFFIRRFLNTSPPETKETENITSELEKTP